MINTLLKTFTLFLCFSSFSQNSNSGIPNVLPRTPQVANLEQYGDIQVGEYSGKPEISIPIYNLKTGSLQFPINLYYDATGIRVNQEASWVGLGWELSTIAAINYRVVGKTEQNSMFYNEDHTIRKKWQLYEILMDDLLKQSMPNPQNYEDEKDPAAGYGKYNFRGSSASCYKGVNSTTEYGEIMEIVELATSENTLTDYFQINCPGLTGSFYIHPGTGQIKAYGEKNKYKIVSLNSHFGFEITNEEGVKYTFTTKELDSFQNVNAWYLSEIKDLKSDHWIKFKYTNFGKIKPIISFQEQIKTGYVPSSSDQNQYQLAYDSTTVLDAFFLTEIETDSEKIVFNLNSLRDDIEGDGKRKLESIEIADKISNKKRYYNFEYGYFDGANVGGDYYYKDTFAGPTHTTPDYFKKRLKLLSISERGELLSANPKKHIFTYNTMQLPYKTSFAKDYWGFYNGANNQTFIPNLLSVMAFDIGLNNMYKNNKQLFDNFFTNSDLANKGLRGANEEFMKAGTLSAITYPTGGKTVFDFTSHTFNNQVVLSTSEESKIATKSNNYSASFNGHSSSTPNTTFTLLKQTLVTLSGNINNVNGKFSCTQLSGLRIGIFGPNGSFYTPYLEFNCAALTSNGGYQSVKQEILLQPGTYVLMAGTSSAITTPNSWDQPVVTANVQYSSFNLDDIIASHSESIGGGLRINQIINYDTDGKFINSKKYTYTSGKLMNQLRMIRTLAYQIVSSVPTYVGTRYANSIRNYATAPIGATVAYDKVTIEQIDKDSNANGKINKYFKNTPISPVFSMINHLSDSSLLNGTVGEIEYINKNNDTVKKEIFTYTTFDLENKFVNILYELNRSNLGEMVTGTSAIDENCNFGADVMYVFPYRSFKNLLTEHKTIDYLKGGQLENTITYDYNLDNYLTAKQKSLNSSNQEISIEYEYPTTYAKSGIYPYNLMVSEKNWLTPIITQTQKNNGIFVGKNSLEYNGFGSVIAPKTISKTKGSLNLEKVITYDKYDNKGNILQYTPEGGTPVSIIWGYNQTQPIAKIENATNAQVAIALGVLDVSILNETNLIAINALRNNSSFANTMITTYTHIPLVGVSTITDPKGDKITYTYDSFGRLQFVKDNKDQILSENQYNYKQ